jgi:hypothetical protein
MVAHESIKKGLIFLKLAGEEGLYNHVSTFLKMATWYSVCAPILWIMSREYDRMRRNRWTAILSAFPVYVAFAYNSRTNIAAVLMGMFGGYLMDHTRVPSLLLNVVYSAIRLGSRVKARVSRRGDKGVESKTIDDVGGEAKSEQNKSYSVVWLSRRLWWYAHDLLISRPGSKTELENLRNKLIQAIQTAGPLQKQTLSLFDESETHVLKWLMQHENMENRGVPPSVWQDNKIK